MEKPSQSPSDSTGAAAASAANQAWKMFVANFYAALQDTNPTTQSASLLDIYEKEYPNLVEHHYKNSILPEWSSFEDNLEPGPCLPLLTLLYTEIYHRHIFQRNLLHLVKTSAREASFRTYAGLFVSIFPDSADSGRTFRSIELPPQVVWDITDEFVYQFEKFNSYRYATATSLTAERSRKGELGTPSKKRDEAVADVLSAFGTEGAAASCWAPERVADMLHRMVDKSQVAEWSKKAAVDPTANPPTVEVLFGYFASLQLLRVYTLIGDYNTALKCVSFVDPSSSRASHALWARVPGACMHLHYYAGLCLLMLRRPFDAIYLFVPGLQFGQQRMRPHSNKSSAHESLVKRQTQLFHLLALAQQACPVRLPDEALMVGLKEKLSEKDLYARLLAAEPAAYSEAFTLAAPKFLAAAPSVAVLRQLAVAHKAACDAYAAHEGASGEAAVHAETTLTARRTELAGLMDRYGPTIRSGVDTQRQVFVRELVSCAPVRALRTYFGLFSVATVAKLASFSERRTGPSTTAAVVPGDEFGDVADSEGDDVERLRAAMLLLRLKGTQFTAATDTTQRARPFNAPRSVQYLSDFDFSVVTDSTGTETIRVTQVPFQASVVVRR